MPRRRRAWAAWNYSIPPGLENHDGKVTLHAWERLECTDPPTLRDQAREGIDGELGEDDVMAVID